MSKLHALVPPRPTGVASGVYRLKRTLQLGPLDDGVHWVAKSPGAIISGSVYLNSWSWFRPPSGGSAGIVQTDVSAVVGRQDRHLWINGERAVRTRMPEASALALFQGSRMTDDGFALAAGVPLPRCVKNPVG